jgi:acyl-CoA thioester hydrolase
MTMPSAGRGEAFRDGVHVHPLRVYYEDTDAGGVVYYANYLKFAERARTEMLRDLGIDPGELAAFEGVAFAISRLEVDYLAPARLDDELMVQTRIVKIFAATLEAEQIISRGATQCARLIVRLASVNRAGRPVRLPESILTAHRSVTGAPWPEGPRPDQLQSQVKKRA